MPTTKLFAAALALAASGPAIAQEEPPGCNAGSIGAGFAIIDATTDWPVSIGQPLCAGQPYRAWCVNVTAVSEPYEPCDIVYDGVVDSLDLSELLNDWGPTPWLVGEGNCYVRADVNDDAVVDVLDLAQLIVAWGDCGYVWFSCSNIANNLLLVPGLESHSWSVDTFSYQEPMCHDLSFTMPFLDLPHNTPISCFFTSVQQELGSPGWNTVVVVNSYVYQSCTGAEVPSGGEWINWSIGP